MEIIILLVVILGSIFEIVLLFKIWGMTNDVKAIYENLPEAPVDIITQFAWAFSENLTRKALEKDATDFEIISFIETDSVAPCNNGGYLVESRWRVQVKGNNSNYERSFKTVISCNDLTKLMNPESWTSSVIL